MSDGGSERGLRRISDGATLWRYISVSAVSVIFGMMPGYWSAMLNQRSQLTLRDVDSEIVKENAAILVRLDEVTELKTQIESLQQEMLAERQSSPRVR